MSSKQSFFTTLGIALALSGCGKGIEGVTGGNLTPNFIGVGSSGSLMAELESLSESSGPFAALAKVAGLTVSSLNSTLTASGVAQTKTGGAGGLVSLKYFIQDIQLCEDIGVNGSAYNGTSGCVYIYKNPGLTSSQLSSQDFYNNYTITESLADADVATRFTDIATAEGLASLRRPIRVTDSMVRTYHYGLVNFMRTIRMKASFKDHTDTTIYRTRANTSVYLTRMDSDRKIEYAKVGDMTNSPTSEPEEVVYMLNNGGQFFKFNQPFTISDADVKDMTNLTVDLVFNPDNFVTAVPRGGNCDPAADPSDGNASSPIYDNANCIGISPNYVKLTPIPRKGTQKTRKEVYRISNFFNSAGLSVGNVRIEFYYNDGDADKKIQGVDVATELAGASTSLFSGGAVASYSATESGGVVTLVDYDGSTSLTGLTRGANSTATLTCRMPDSSSGCMTSGGTVSKSVTFVGDFAVSTD